MKKNLTFGLLVSNYDEAIHFYQNKLGFVVVDDIPMGHDRWVTITVPGNRHSIITLHEAKTEIDRALVGKQFGTFPYLGLSTEDCIGDYERMKALGVEFQGEPNVQPYGTGVMLEDLYGNKIYINQDPGS